MLSQWLQQTPASAVGSRSMLAWERLVFEACDAHILVSREGLSRRAVLVPLLEALGVSSRSPQTLSVQVAEMRAMRVLQSHAMWMHLVGKTSSFPRQQQQQGGDEFSYRGFVAQSRQHFILQNKTPVMRRHSYQRVSRLPLGLDASAHVWRCRIEDVAVVTHDVSRNMFTLLTVMQFWRHLGCIRLDYSPADCGQLSIASVFNPVACRGGYTKLVLDGTHRWMSSLPSSAATTGTTLMGYVVGDYVGYQPTVGTIYITTYAWPGDSADALAYAWHWTVDAASLSAESLVVSLVIESARVQTSCLPSAFEVMAVAKKLRSIGRWQHLCQVQLLYYAYNKRN